MVAKAKRVSTQRAVKKPSKSPKVKVAADLVKPSRPPPKEKPLTKIRVGIIIGKDFDPVKPGTQWPDFPDEYVRTDDDWGKYSADACTALRVQQLHPDLISVDMIPNEQINQKRLKKNHVNFNFWGDIGIAMMSENRQYIAEVTRCHEKPECRLYPSWDFYHWMVCKPRYMEQCQRAGIPMIPTVIYKNGFDPDKCLRDVKKKGWDKFFVKVGYHSFFGQGAIHGKLDDFLGSRYSDLVAYAKENKKSNYFLVQPYMLKPNGEVFDEVRNFFVDGQWRYSVFTHGTDESDDGYYAEPEGPRKAACKAMAERVYEQVLKASLWEGKRQRPLLNRIDIGIIPKKGADSLHKTDNTYFLNEVEPMITTWLDRYAPISVQDVMAQATVKQTLELVAGSYNAGVPLPDRAGVKKTLSVLNHRLGPFKHVRV